VLPVKFAISSRENLRRRRRRSQRIAKAVHRPALKIDARKQRRCYTLLAFTQQSPRPFRIFDIPRKQDDSGRLQPREQGTDPRRHLLAVEPDDQNLS
jgi:hypothetical protein